MTITTDWPALEKRLLRDIKKSEQEISLLIESEKYEQIDVAKYYLKKKEDNYVDSALKFKDFSVLMSKVYDILYGPEYKAVLSVSKNKN